MPVDFMPDLTVFQAAVENSSDLVEFLSEEGTILYINSAANHVLGASPDALIGTSRLNFVHPNDRALVREELASALALGQATLGPYRYRTASGEWRWFESTIARVASPACPSPSNHPTLIVNSRDVTEQQRPAHGVSPLGLGTHRLLENMSDAFFTLDTQWNFTYLNRAGERVLQRRRKELLGQNVWDEFPEAVYSLFYVQYHLAMKEQREVMFEEFYPPLNVWFEVRAYPSPTGLAVYFCDITERKQKEHELRESEQLFRRIFEDGPLAIAVVDPDTHLLHVNPQLCQMLGYTEEELLKLSIADITHPSDLAEDLGLFQQLLVDDFPCYRMEKRYLAKDGSVVWGALTSSVAREENGKPLYALRIIEDITERREAEQKLRQSEANLARAQQIAGLGSWELDLSNPDDFKANHLYWSDEIFRLFGYEPGQFEVTNEDFFNGLHPDDREQVMDAMTTAISGEKPYDTNLRVIWPDGSMHIVHAQADIIRDEQTGQPLKVIGTCQDITERVRNEEAQSRLVAIIESSADAIISKTLEGIITTWNYGAEQIYGYTAEEAIGLHMGQLLRPDQPSQESLLLSSARAGKLVRNLETDCIRKDGQLINISISGAPLRNSEGEVVGISSITRDITAQKRTEIEREQSLAVLEATLESTVDGILVANKEGHMTHYNQQFVRLWNLPDEIMESGDDLRAIEFAKEQLVDPEGFQKATEKLIADSKRSGFDLLYFKDGRVVERYTQVQRVGDHEGGRVWSFRDITQKVIAVQEQAQHNLELEQRVARRTEELARRTEQLASKNRDLEAEVIEKRMAVGALREVVVMLEQAKQEAEQANRAKSAFLSRMSHELRTPMNAILGFGQLLEMSDLEGHDRVGVEQILQAGRHLLQLINEMLEISRIEAGRMSLSIEPIEVFPMIREALSLIRPLAQQRQITLNSVTDNDASNSRYILGDKTRLHQVMLNLLSNAVKYNSEGGSVTISLEQSAGSSGLQSDGWMRISLSDTGPGIALGDQQRIFLPFERLHADASGTEGTGIGLTLTKSLVELMGGVVGLSSDLGQGSTFWIELPLAPPPAALEAPAGSQSPASDTLFPTLNRPLTFLYIEDNAFNLKLMEALIEKAPQVRLLTANQGSIGVELARSHHIDLILLDLHLTDMTGLDVLHQLQKNPATSGIPVIMVSADATSSQVNELLAAGARHYITKPFGFKQFAQVVQDVLKPTIP